MCVGGYFSLISGIRKEHEIIFILFENDSFLKRRMTIYRKSKRKNFKSIL